MRNTAVSSINQQLFQLLQFLHSNKSMTAYSSIHATRTVLSSCPQLLPLSTYHHFHCKSDFSFDLSKIARYFHKISFCGRTLPVILLDIVQKFVQNFARTKTIIRQISFALLLHNTVRDLQN